MFSLCSTLENVYRVQNKQGTEYKDKEFEGTGLIQSTEEAQACRHEYSKRTLLAAKMQVTHRKLDKTQTQINWVGCEMNFKQDFQENPAVFLSSMPRYIRLFQNRAM